MAWNDKPLISITGPALFWIFMMAVLGCGTFIWVKHPPSALTQLIMGTKEERMLRNLQDPLAMRLWVVSQTSFWDGNVRNSITSKVIDQWKSEVETLKDKAYHTSAAPVSWDVNKLDLTEEQKKAVSDVKQGVLIDGQVKPGW